MKLVAAELAENASKQFIVLHTYGSHFNYRERYPADHAFFLPDFPVDAELKYKDNSDKMLMIILSGIQIIFWLVSSGCYRNRT